MSFMGIFPLHAIDSEFIFEPNGDILWLIASVRYSNGATDAGFVYLLYVCILD